MMAFSLVTPSSGAGFARGGWCFVVVEPFMTLNGFPFIGFGAEEGGGAFRLGSTDRTPKGMRGEVDTGCGFVGAIGAFLCP